MLDGVGVSRREKLDRAVPAISDPAIETQDAGLSERPPAKANTLNIPCNDQTLGAHPPVPHTYDGLVWLYDCTDELIWEGALVIAVR